MQAKCHSQAFTGNHKLTFLLRVADRSETWQHQQECSCPRRQVDLLHSSTCINSGELADMFCRQRVTLIWKRTSVVARNDQRRRELRRQASLISRKIKTFYANKRKRKAGTSVPSVSDTKPKGFFPLSLLSCCVWRTPMLQTKNASVTSLCASLY